MPRHYLRSRTAFEERFGVSIAEFPEGQGPALCIRQRSMDWPRLGPGSEAVVELDGGDGGAATFGMTVGHAVILAFLPPDRPGRAYCHHSPSGHVDPGTRSRAVRALGLREGAMEDRRSLTVILASAQPLGPGAGRVGMGWGALAERVFCYSPCRVPLFGISALGTVGEIR